MATDLEAVAKERGLEYFLISFTDLVGVQRAKLVPASAMAAWPGPVRHSRASPRGWT